MNSSRPQSRTRLAAKSTENNGQFFGVIQQLALPLDRQTAIPGSLDDRAMIRGVLTEVIRGCGKSRAQIADEMSYLAGREVTERMINGFTAESKEDYRWPAELDRAFCVVTGDSRLLTCRAELAGLRLIDSEEMELLELGRAFLQRSQAEEKIALLQRRMQGGAL
jgi:hypothetical protein